MYIEYDGESDAAFLWAIEPDELAPGTIDGELWPQECQDHIGLLFNDAKQLVGVEVLFATAHLPDAVIARVRGLDEYAAASDAAFLWAIESDEIGPSTIDAELWPQELLGHIGLLFDDAKQLVGVKVLRAIQHLPDAVIARVRPFDHDAT